MTEQKHGRILVILAMALLFVIVGWTAPAMFATSAPDSHYMETHEFVADDVTVGESEHRLHWDRTIHQQNTGSIFIELTVVSEDDDRVTFDTYRRDAIYQEGRQTTIIEQPLPEDIEPGVYRYEMVVEMQLVDGRVTRSFDVTSEPFTIQE